MNSNNLFSEQYTAGVEEICLFVYGTLMSNHRKGKTYLDTAVLKGKAILNEFQFHNKNL